MNEGELDLGEGFALRFTTTHGRPDDEKTGAIMRCRHGEEGSILFDVHHVAEDFPDRPRWQVVSWEPIELSPSIQTPCCHGHIRQGRWVDDMTTSRNSQPAGATYRRSWSHEATGASTWVPGGAEPGRKTAR